MGNKQHVIMDNLESLLIENQENKIDFMMMYSIIEKNKLNMDDILKLKDTDVLKLKAEELKEFFTGYKIVSAILEQMISTKITTDEQTELTDKLHLNFPELKEDQSKPRVSMLMSYSYFLEKNPDLIDSKMERFLDFLENGKGDPSALAFEDLSQTQRDSVPEDIQHWIAKNTLFN